MSERVSCLYAVDAPMKARKWWKKKQEHRPHLHLLNYCIGCRSYSDTVIQGRTALKSAKSLQRRNPWRQNRASNFQRQHFVPVPLHKSHILIPMAVTDPANQIKMLKQILKLKMCNCSLLLIHRALVRGDFFPINHLKEFRLTMTIKSFQVLLSVHGYVPITQPHSSSVRILEDPRASCTRGIREAKKFKQPQKRHRAQKDSVKMYREQKWESQNATSTDPEREPWAIGNPSAAGTVPSGLPWRAIT